MNFAAARMKVRMGITAKNKRRRKSTPEVERRTGPENLTEWLDPAGTES